MRRTLPHQSHEAKKKKKIRMTWRLLMVSPRREKRRSRLLPPSKEKERQRCGCPGGGDAQKGVVLQMTTCEGEQKSADGGGVGDGSG